MVSLLFPQEQSREKVSKHLKIVCSKVCLKFCMNIKTEIILKFIFDQTQEENLS